MLPVGGQGRATYEVPFAHVPRSLGAPEIGYQIFPGMSWHRHVGGGGGGGGFWGAVAAPYVMT